MPPTPKRSGQPGMSSATDPSKASIDEIRRIARIVFHILTCPHFTKIVGYVILVLDFFLSVVVIMKVNYTEIDWTTYMQQVSVFLEGNRDYSLITGSTGPCVYPAGHLYSFSILHYLTNQGSSIVKGQCIFLLMYLINGILVIRIYQSVQKVPPYILSLLFLTAYRVHSIFLLRLFNDALAITLFNGSLLLFIWKRWTSACTLFSLAVSIKMNILLFAPGVLLVLMENLSVIAVIRCLSLSASIQIFLALPFLLRHPWSYMKGAFDLSRIFLFKWTVNWKFLPPEVFLNRYFHILLLSLHLFLLVILFHERWLTVVSKSWEEVHASITRPSLQHQHEQLNVTKEPGDQDDGRNEKTRPSSSEEDVDVSHAERVAHTLFLTNFIGVVFARSMHYQFYVWYFYSIPFLLWSTPFNTLFRLLMMGAIEWSWNIYPSTEFSSGLLFTCHLLILGGNLYALLIQPLPVAILCVKKKRE